MTIERFYLVRVSGFEPPRYLDAGLNSEPNGYTTDRWERAARFQSFEAARSAARGISSLHADRQFTYERVTRDEV